MTQKSSCITEKPNTTWVIIHENCNREACPPDNQVCPIPVLVPVLLAPQQVLTVSTMLGRHWQDLTLSDRSHVYHPLPLQS